MVGVGFGEGVDVVGFVGDEGDVLVGKVVVGEAVFAGLVKATVQPLNGGEEDTDVVGVGALEIGDFTNADCFGAEFEGVGEQVFGGEGVEEVVARFFDDVTAVDEEQEVAIPMLV